MISRINLRRGNGRHRWRSAENAPPQFMHKLVSCLVRFPRRDGRQYRGNKHGQSIITQRGFHSLRIFVSPRPTGFTQPAGRGGNFKPEGGERKKVTFMLPSPPTRYRSIEFATLSTPFFQLALWLSDVIALKSCFENTRGRETNIRDKKRFLGRLKLVDINRLDNRSKEKEER